MKPGMIDAGLSRCPACQLWVLTQATKSCPNCGLVAPHRLGMRPRARHHETKLSTVALKGAAAGAVTGFVWGLALWFMTVDAGLLYLLVALLLGAAGFSAVIALLSTVVAALFRLPGTISSIQLARYEARLRRREPHSLVSSEAAVDEIIKKFEHQIRSLKSLAERVKRAQTERHDDSSAVARLANNLSLIRRAIDEREVSLASARVERMKLQYQRWLLRLEALLDGATDGTRDLPRRINELDALESEANRGTILVRALPSTPARDELARLWSDPTVLQEAKSTLQLAEERALHADTRRLVDGVKPLEDELYVPDRPPRRIHGETALLLRIGADIAALSEQEQRLDAECAALREVEDLLTIHQRASQ
jgi:hypothetical protein